MIKSPTKKWTEKDEKFLKMNYRKYGSKYCSEHLLCSRDQIIKKVYKIGISKKNKKWTNEDILFLKENYSKHGGIYCAKYLKRNYINVAQKAQQLKLKRYSNPIKGIRTCPACKTEKSIEFFGKNSRNKSHIGTYCRSCQITKQNERRQKNKFLFWASNTYYKHRQKYSINFSINDLTKIAERTHRCAFCQKKMSWDNQKIIHDSPSLDRLDNNFNLSLDNIAIICYRCNLTKSNRSINEFKNDLVTILPQIEMIIEKRNDSLIDYQI